MGQPVKYFVTHKQTNKPLVGAVLLAIFVYFYVVVGRIGSLGRLGGELALSVVLCPCNM
jgi:hypothetical protein